MKQMLLVSVMLSSILITACGSTEDLQGRFDKKKPTKMEAESTDEFTSGGGGETNMEAEETRE